MSRPLQPLAAIRVFEAAARHLSFTKAAEELGMTQAAASYQIKLLTRHLYRQDIAEGRLIQPFAIVGTDNDSYWLVHAEFRRNVPKIRAFRDWLLDAVERDKIPRDRT